jgi:hypothetical protein
MRGRSISAALCDRKKGVYRTKLRLCHVVCTSQKKKRQSAWRGCDHARNSTVGQGHVLVSVAGTRRRPPVGPTLSGIAWVWKEQPRLSDQHAIHRPRKIPVDRYQDSKYYPFYYIISS